MTKQHIDPAEVAKFDKIAASWWDPHGKFKPLHAINPPRLDFILNGLGNPGTLDPQTILDIGCGGGILSEALAHKGAQVTGIDASAKTLTVAQYHAAQSNLKIDYQNDTAENFAAKHPEPFDIITCMELLEHVPNPKATISTCAKLTRPGGHLFFSTLNRTPKAYLFGVIGAEYILNLLPKGTHDYAKFIRPSELNAWARAAGLTLQSISGLHYQPFSNKATLTANTQINYLAHYTKPVL